MMFAVMATVSMCVRLVALDPHLRLGQYVHESWHQADGLPASTIDCLQRTPDGYLWLGTPAGLVRFDGARFVVVPTEAGDVANQASITSLAVGADAALWIGTRSNGLRRLDKTGSHAIDIKGADPMVRAIRILADGTVRIGTTIGLFDLRNNAITGITTADSYIAGMVGDSSGRTWIATHKSVEVINHGVPDVLAKGDDYTAETLLVDHRGQVWIGTYQRLLRWPSEAIAKHERPTEVLQQHIQSLYEDRAGNLWVGTATGLVRLRTDDLAGAPHPEVLPLRNVIAILEDDEGSLWVGSRDGLHRLRNPTAIPWTIDEGLPSNAPPSVNAGLDGSIYIFSSDQPGGMAQFDGQRVVRQVQLSDGPSYIDHAGRIWVGTTGLITCVDGERVVKYDASAAVPPQWISAIGEDDQGLILALASLGGIVRWSPGHAEPYRLRDGSAYTVPHHVMSIFRQRDGSWWTAGFDGAAHFKDGEVTRYTTTNGEKTYAEWYAKHPQSATCFHTVTSDRLAESWVSSMAEDRHGALWLASMRGGLTRFYEGKFTPYTTRHGLPTNDVYTVLTDEDDNVWLSSSRGIIRLRWQELDDVATGRAATFQPRWFTTADGLKSEECLNIYEPASCKRTDGTLWFTTGYGVVSIDPRHLPHNPVPPSVLIEQVLADDRALPANAEAQVPPGTHKLEFQYTAPSLQVPSRVNFKFRLEGFDAAWVDAGTRRTAYYTEVPPGRYSFRVIASNNDGVWNEYGARIAVIVQPFFYQTAWFYALVAIGLGAGVFGGHRWRVRHLRAQEQELRLRVDERTAQLSTTNAELLREIEVRKRAEAEVARIHRRLVDASRHAGMAEVAIAVLHKVGNALNSVNVSAGLLVDRVHRSHAAALPKLAGLLREQAPRLPEFLAQDPRGQKLPEYIGTLADVIGTEQAELKRELSDLIRNVDEIKTIVEQQQVHVRATLVIEEVDVSALLKEVVLARTAPLTVDHVAVELVDAEHVRMPVEASRLRQVIDELLREAANRCQLAAKEARRIVVRVGSTAAAISIRIEYPGAPIDDASAAALFQMQAAAAESQRTLHDTANTAREMGANLTVATGVGFHLELPRRHPATA